MGDVIIRFRIGEFAMPGGLCERSWLQLSSPCLQAPGGLADLCAHSSNSIVRLVRVIICNVARGNAVHSMSANSNYGQPRSFGMFRFRLPMSRKRGMVNPAENVDYVDYH
jgi:hypothetical protein